MKTNPRICIILGTRPEIIKLAPVVFECTKRKVECFTVHTGQHYSFEMDKLMFQDLKLPDPRYNLHVGSGTHGLQTAKILIDVETILIKERPDVVLVQGDTNSVLAGALAAAKIGVRIGHIESGLRSGDRRMPEEINRIVVDHISDYLFVPTRQAVRNLLNEGLDRKKIIVTGNTIVDAVERNVRLARRNSSILETLNVMPNKFILLTLHRAENVDKKEVLEKIIHGILLIESTYHIPIVWPMHPRTKLRLEEYHLLDTLCRKKGILIINPLGFLDFLQLEANARLIMTDSGGVQEEACILRVPCVTVRDNTERPESVLVKANIVAGVQPRSLLKAVAKMFLSKRTWKNPFGDGKAAKLIVDECVKPVRS